MSVHKHNLSFQPNPSLRRTWYTPHIRQVIKNTKQQQIRHHNVTVTHSPERDLINRTKKLIDYDSPSDKFSKTITSGLTGSLDARRGSTRMRSKRDSRLNETKKQLELLNELYKNNNKDQIKRYQDQIQQEQSQIHTVVAQYRLKRKWGKHQTARGRTRQPSLNLPKTANNPELTGDLSLEKSPLKNKNQFDQLQMDVLFDRMHPYRRLLITRRRSKGKVEPWTIANNSN